MLNEFIKTKEEAWNALLGTVIADGSIAKARGKSYHTKTYLEITHTSKNLDYLKVIKELLFYLGINSSITEHNKKTENKTYTLFRLSTESTEDFIQLRNILYDSDRNKKFPKEIIDRFTDLSLFFSYLDDGTLKVRYYEGSSKVREYRATFCFDSFTLEELQYFRNWLKSRYDIDTHIYRHSKNMPLNRGFRIWTNTLNTEKLMKVFNKYYDLVPSMKYKFCKYYTL